MEQESMPDEGYWLVPYFFTTIPLLVGSKSQYTETLSTLKESQESFHSNSELKKMVEFLLNRINNLEKSETDQTKQLLKVTQAVEGLKNNQSELLENFTIKMMNFEQKLEYQNENVQKSESEELIFVKNEFQKLKKMYDELKTCCEITSNAVDKDEVKRQADLVFSSYFGDDFTKKDVLNIFQIMNSKIQENEFLNNNKKNEANPAVETNLGIDEIRRIVLEVLKVYDADKTGRVDYALESAGGQIISTRCTQRYNIHTRAFKILGLTLYYESNNPRTVIQGNNLQPGMCWAFQDFPGYLLIKLRSPIYVTGFTVEHAPKSNLPNGEMKSAPKKFEVWGLKEENDSNPVIFGEYEFVDSDESLQFFPVKNLSITEPYDYVEMRIHSNHGQLEYTCLYRFRVHGNLA